MKKKKGQAVVEFALVLPILVLLLCGITDFGRILFAANNINMVSQEAARCASFGKDDESIKEVAKNSCSLSGTLDVNIANASFPDAPATPRKSGDYVTVNISYDVDYITPLMQSIIGSSFTVKASSTIRVE